MKRSEFNSYLQKYINGGCLKTSDRFFYIVSPKTIFRKNAIAIQSYFHQSEKGKKDLSSVVQIKVNTYTGENKFVLDLFRFLNNNLKNYLAGAYVHGSIGTSEEINYSDFDALVILKDETLNDAAKLSEAAYLINQARCFMFLQDPLQHHGWFVLTETDLNNYDETYFPSELFHHTKSLFLDRGFELNLMIAEHQDYKTPFKNLCNSIEKKLEGQPHPKNLYELKNLLSEFMLLPALYVQARDKKGIYKKFSFQEARKDFSNNEWHVMDEVSLIRKNWNVEIPRWKRKLIASSKYFSFNLSKLLAPKISDELKEKMSMGFYQSMLNFTKTICKKIQ